MYIVIPNEHPIFNHQTSSLIIENPTVLLPRLLFLLGGQLGDIEDDTNLLGTLAHELT